MLYFENDYTEGCHEKVLEQLCLTNREKLAGYACDFYTKQAEEKLKKYCECQEADVYFMTGGTQTNLVVISSLLKSFEGVVAAKTGHISIHEAGAIEKTGHKVLEVAGEDGKISATALKQLMESFWQDKSHEHMVFPGMVYISHPTEYGTLYSKEELEQISSICRFYKVPLYLDGARIGYGLQASTTDVTLPMIAEYCDVFYIGGTKVGALCGEAIVFTKKNMPPHFNTMVKQQGAMLAKGRLVSVQFDALFTDDLYFNISKHAILMAEQLKKVLQDVGCQFYLDSPTNQQFVILENSMVEKLEQYVKFSFWEAYDENHTVIRFVTSWATTKEDIEQLRGILEVAQCNMEEKSRKVEKV